MVDSPVVYPGGKATIRNFICDEIPPHMTWVDVFGGGGSITLHKKPSFVEVYNDAGFVSLFFALLRHDYAGPILKEKLKLSPMSEEEFQYCRKNWKYQTDPIEQIRMWYVTILQCFTHEEEGAGWIGTGRRASVARAYKNHIDTLDEVIERFREVHISHRHFRDVIPLYDSPDTLFYCDPPYLNEKGEQVSVGYFHEMTVGEHRELLDMLSKVKGQVMLSGYNNPLYEERLKDWELRTLTRNCKIFNMEQFEAGVVTERTECLWMRRNSTIVGKPAPAAKPTKNKAGIADEHKLVTLWETVGS